MSLEQNTRSRSAGRRLHLASLAVTSPCGMSDVICKDIDDIKLTCFMFPLASLPLRDILDSLLLLSLCAGEKHAARRPLPGRERQQGLGASGWCCLAHSLSRLYNLPPLSGFTLGPTETNGNQATGRRKKTTGWLVLVVGGNQSY